MSETSPIIIPYGKGLLRHKNLRHESVSWPCDGREWSSRISACRLCLSRFRTFFDTLHVHSSHPPLPNSQPRHRTMIKSAITVSIVEQARKGPFVFHDDVADACRIASELGFDAVELFAPSAAAIQSLPLADLLKRHHLRLAAVGTALGWWFINCNSATQTLRGGKKPNTSSVTL